MATYKSVLEAVGKTPLIKLQNITRDIKADIYVKAELLNPGGSVKDRIAVKIIESAEKEGLLKTGGTIIEATAGNTGVGLAMVAAVKGYKCVFVMPDKMSQDKINLLKAYGAEVVVTPTSVAPDSPESYNGVADTGLPGRYRALTGRVSLTTPPTLWRTTSLPARKYGKIQTNASMFLLPGWAQAELFRARPNT